MAEIDDIMDDANKAVITSILRRLTCTDIPTQVVAADQFISYFATMMGAKRG